MPPKRKPKLTAAERHDRFVKMAHGVGANESPKAFDRAIAKVVKGKPQSSDKRQVVHVDSIRSSDDADEEPNGILHRHCLPRLTVRDWLK